jgi:hypothetical protein
MAEDLQPDGALPELLCLDGPLPGGYRLERPVSAERWFEAGEYVVDVPEFEVYVFGATPDDALANVNLRIVEQRMSIEASAEDISPLLADVGARLRSIVLPADA